jgi:hypothetical protein
MMTGELRAPLPRLSTRHNQADVAKCPWQASADRQRGSHNAAMGPGFTSWVTQGCKIINRNLSMTEWNELLVEVLPIKEAAGAYASQTELQETLQPPTDLPTLAGSCGHGGERRHSPRKPGNSRMGPTAQASAGGLRLMCRFRQDDRAWFHHLRRGVRRVKAVAEAKS